MGDEERRIKNVAEYREDLLAISERWRSLVLAFRGQEDRDWPLESSGERRLKKSLKGRGRISDSSFIEYHRDNLVQKGKLRNYDKREGKQLADLELLADLQHHGAATCLLDFTRNALVALWFACENSHGESDGKVFVVNTADDHGGFQEVTPRDIVDKSIKEVLEFKTRDEDPAREHTDQDSLKPPSDEAQFWYWTPAHLNERITAQDSLFLFARPSSGKPNSEDIVVAAECKGQIRKELETLYNTHEESLFPDFVGFAYTQRHDAPVDIPDSEKYRRRGIEAEQRGEQQRAIEHYTKSLELDPDNAVTYWSRGGAHARKDEFDLAIQDYTKSLDLNPDDAVAYPLRGAAHYHKGEFDLAIQDYTKSLDLDPDNAVTYHLRGAAHYRKDEFDLAIQDYTKSLDLNPDDAFTYLQRGLAHHRKDEFDLAIQDYTKSLDLDPDDAVAYHFRGSAYYETRSYDRAIQDYTKSLELDPDNAVEYHLRGSVYYETRSYDRAIQDFDKALALDPDDSYCYFRRSLVWLCMSKWTSAESDWTSARSKGLDITTAFSDMYRSVEDFEQKHRVKLPVGIASMLSTEPSA